MGFLSSRTSRHQVLLLALSLRYAVVPTPGLSMAVLAHGCRSWQNAPNGATPHKYVNNLAHI